jgi:flagellar hook-length control protein FliK
LVKQLLATQSVAEKPVKQVVTVETVETVEKIAPLNLGGTKLRPDILHALTAKTTSTSESNAPLISITKRVLENTVKTVDDTQVEKIRQLVDILKPAKADEQFARSIPSDKIAAAIPSTFTASTGATVASTVVKVDVPTLDILPSLQSKAWNNVLSSRVVWMAREGIQQAALKLNPANLGPVEVRLNIQNEQANITFIAQNPATRDALEQALPRLRESFMENGLELANADVSDHASQQANDETDQDGEEVSNGDSVAKMKESANENGQEAATKARPELESGLSVYA